MDGNAQPANERGETGVYDAIIIGAGHNGLVCANYLAKAGKRVLVLERRHVLGGAAVTEEIAPGFRASIFSYLMSLLHPRIIADFELNKHGLEVLPCSDMVSPLAGDDYVLFSDNTAKTQASFAKFSAKDAAIYPEFNRYLQESAQIVRKLLWETPIDPTKRDWRTFRDGASILWKYRKVGRKAYRIVDMMTMSAYDFLREWFEDDRVMAVLAYYASIGTFAGPKTPGSAYVIMHHIMGEHDGAGGWGFIKGGMGAITQALAAYGRGIGVQHLTGAEIKEVRIAGGRATSVVTSNGETYRGKVIASNVDAKSLYLGMVGENLLPEELAREIRNYRTFSTALVLSEAFFRSRIELAIEQFRSKAPNVFANQLKIILETIAANKLISALQTNVNMAYVSYVFSPEYSIQATALIYRGENGSDCDCAIDLHCRIRASFDQNFGEASQLGYDNLETLPGISAGCLPVSSILVSTLECFYNQTCVNGVISHFPTNEEFTAMSLDVPSRFRPDSSVQAIIDRLMVENWTTAIYYDKYYAQCAPTTCTYPQSQRHGFLIVLTRLISLLSGLVLVLGLSIPKLVQFIGEWWRRRAAHERRPQITRKEYLRAFSLLID